MSFYQEIKKRKNKYSSKNINKKSIYCKITILIKNKVKLKIMKKQTGQLESNKKPETKNTIAKKQTGIILKNHTNKLKEKLGKLKNIDVYPNDGYSNIVKINDIKFVIDFGIHFTAESDAIYITKKKRC